MSLVPTMGAVLIGDAVSTGLYGLTTLQVYLYFRKCWDTDPWRLKGFIFYIWLLETVHTFLIWSFLFHCLIIEFGSPAALFVTRVSDDVTTLITGLIIFSVHLFYIRRLWILSINTSYRLTLVVVVTILAVLHFAFEIAVMVLTFRFPEFSQFHKITAYYTGSMALAAADDLIIAVAMWYLLNSRRTGIRSTNTLVNRIISFSVMTGALTSLVDVAILICFVTMQQNLIYLAMYNLVNNLYANSLLAMINARESLGKITPGGTTSFALSDLRTAGNSSMTPRTDSNGRQVLSKITFSPFKQPSVVESLDCEVTSSV